MLHRTLSAIVCASALLVASASQADTPATVHLRGSDEGQTFEGIGGVSAGASTRLLADYPEPYRSDVLDFLFKPNFGAGFQHLKVEIGGGENSTCGSEPSHAITREELAHPRDRGYEFWLMREARNRNPQVLLDCLPWSYPGWIGGPFSQDATDWFVAFLEVARKQQMEVNWVSAAQNENRTDRNWIVDSLRPTFNKRGFGAVKIQAPDNNKAFWKIFDEFDNDPAYRDVVDAVGYHYLNGREPWKIDQASRAGSTAKAKASGKQLWASEEWSNSGAKWDGVGAMFLARLFNKLYIRDRVCKTEIWCPIDSIYQGLPYAGTGAMQATEPWSGHYAVWPTVWAVAHTTQFAAPGWKYLDGGCGQIDPDTWKGTYVTLKDAKSGDWSMIICTDGPTQLSVTLADGLKADRVHVWHSSADAQFVKEADIVPANDAFAIALAGNSIYSLTTTTGQQKGEPPHAIPAAKPFPLPYSDDFEAYEPGQTPRYFSDQKGTFEVFDEPGHGKCLKQIMPEHGILWQYQKKIVTPYTVIGDQKWSDYALAADVRVDGGYVELGGRFGDQNRLSYRWILSENGDWKLQYQAITLAEGNIKDFDQAAWHAMKIVFQGSRIRGHIDGRLLADVEEATRSNGMAYLASSYNGNLFDNVRITPVEESSAKSPDAFEQNKRLGRGVNVLGYDPLWKGRSKGRFRAEHFALIHEAGFNHVRVNIHPFRDADSKQSTTISDNYFRTLDWAIDQALANKLMVVVDFHEYEEMARDPEGNKDRFLGMWRQIAEHCKNAPSEVVFEILNEPNKKVTPELWNQYLREALGVIRESNPTRTVIVGPADWNNLKRLGQLQLSDDDRNLIVTVHYYSPFEFTHQGASWTDRKDKVGVTWEGTEKEREAIVRDFEKAQAWAESHHRPLYMGEFGAIEKGDMASRLRWISFVARQAEKMGWSWAYWQFEGNFIVYDIANNRWVEPIRDALIPPSP